MRPTTTQVGDRPGSDPQTPTFSVIIAAYSLARLPRLRASIASLRSQRGTAHQIIVGVDGNPELLERIREEFPDVLAQENDRFPGAGGARNAASSVATGDVLAFIDDDVEAHPDWLSAQARHFADERVLGVGGTIEPDWEATRPSWFPPEFDWVIGCTYVGSPTSTESVRNLIGANMSVRRDVFEQLEGFRHSFGKVGDRSSPEETDLCIRAGQRWTTRHWLFDPAVAVRHHVPESRARFRYFMRRCWWEGVGKADLSDLVGQSSGTESEREYARKTLPRGILHHLRQTRPAATAGAQKAMTIVLGFTVTALGYLWGRLNLRLMRHRNP